jgi:hypothetical protein
VVTAILVVVTVLVAGGVIAYALYTTRPGSNFQPPSGGSIGLACTKSNATAYRCSIINADATVDFTRVDVTVVDSAGTLECSARAPVTMGPMDCSMGSRVDSARIVDNGDVSFRVGDDFYLSPHYFPTPTSLAGMTLKLSGGGEGSATMN